MPGFASRILTSTPPQLACGTVNWSNPTTCQPSFCTELWKLLAMFRL